MTRQLTRRLLRGGALAAVIVLLSTVLPLPNVSVAGLQLAAAPAAYAAGPDTVSISGPGLEEELRVRLSENPERFGALLNQVNWLSARPGEGRTPDPSQLGAVYVLTIFVADKATERYELYPQATGGPRVFRPAKQPDGHQATAAWFYGRLTMPETLLDLGASASGTISGVTGGAGGGGIADKQLDPNADLTSLLSEWRRVLLLNGAVVIVIAAGVAGVALLIRRRVDRKYRRAEQIRPVRRF